jgi:hypothetical protein
MLTSKAYTIRQKDHVVDSTEDDQILNLLLMKSSSVLDPVTEDPFFIKLTDPDPKFCIMDP